MRKIGHEKKGKQGAEGWEVEGIELDGGGGVSGVRTEGRNAWENIENG
jgi:hypothetical protein